MLNGPFFLIRDACLNVDVQKDRNKHLKDEEEIKLKDSVSRLMAKYGCWL